MSATYSMLNHGWDVGGLRTTGSTVGLGFFVWYYACEILGVPSDHMAKTWQQFAIILTWETHRNCRLNLNICSSLLQKYTKEFPQNVKSLIHQFMY